MKDIQQLIKKNSQEGRYEDIFPKTFLDAVIDKESGTTLTDILSSFNMYFLSYTGSRETTRLEVPMSLRKQGLWITYVLYDGNTITEWYGINAVDDASWQDGNNWRLGSNMLVGDISISAGGNWIINGVDTGIPARGEKGDSAMLRVNDSNKLQVSYTNGNVWIDLSDNPVYTQFRVNNNKLEQSIDLGETWSVVSDYIAAWFRFTGTIGSSQANNVGKIQISRDNGAIWSDLSGEFTNSLHIKGYVATVDALPSTAVQGDIYGVGPTYDPSDTEHTNHIYQLYVKDSTGWVNNGRFTSISAGVVQELGNSETAVISQKGVTDNFINMSQLGGVAKTPTLPSGGSAYIVDFTTDDGIIVGAKRHYKFSTLKNTTIRFQTRNASGPMVEVSVPINSFGVAEYAMVQGGTIVRIYGMASTETITLIAENTLLDIVGSMSDNNEAYKRLEPNTNLDAIKDAGIYLVKGSYQVGSYMMLVFDNGANSIGQLTYGFTSSYKCSIRIRTFNGTSWTAWDDVFDYVKATFLDETTNIDTITSNGLYLKKGGQYYSPYILMNFDGKQVAIGNGSTGLYLRKRTFINGVFSEWVDLWQNNMIGITTFNNGVSLSPDGTITSLAMKFCSDKLPITTEKIILNNSKTTGYNGNVIAYQIAFYDSSSVVIGSRMNLPIGEFTNIPANAKFFKVAGGYNSSVDKAWSNEDSQNYLSFSYGTQKGKLDIMDDDINSHNQKIAVLENKIDKFCINNPLNQTAAENPCTLIDSKGRMYVSYISSPVGIGESFHSIDLSVFSMVDFTHIEHYNIATASEFGSQNILGNNICEVSDNIIRVFFRVGVYGEQQHYYKDFNKSTKQVGNAVKVKFKSSNSSSPVDFTLTNITNAYTGTSYTPPTGELTMTSNIVIYNDNLFTTVSSTLSNTMVVKSTDFGATWEKVGFIGNLSQYENELSVVGDIMYCFLRNGAPDSGVSGPARSTRNLWKSVDSGATWIDTTLDINMGNNRGASFTLNGKLYLAYSDNNQSSNWSITRPWRSSVGIYEYNEADNSLKQVKHFTDKYGFVEIDIVIHENSIFLLFSNGKIYQMYRDGGTFFYGYSQGKDALYITEVNNDFNFIGNYSR